jgi:hypothetical protein
MQGIQRRQGSPTGCGGHGGGGRLTSTCVGPRVCQPAKRNPIKFLSIRPGEPTDLSRFIDDEFSNEVKKNTDLSPQDALKVLMGRQPSPRAENDAHWLISEELSEIISASSHLVLWWNGKRFTPAIWCDNVKTAFYVRALLDVVGGKGLRICPHCSEIFFQKRPDQNYCSVAHREAHRVARWRAMKLSKSKRKGEKRGTRQTR